MSTNSPDDLSDLFGPKPAGASQDLTYRQGIVLSFNAVTLQNTVQIGSTILTDLPLLGVGEATLLTAGSVVGVLVVGRDTKSMYITGRIVQPNTADAFDAIALLSANVHADTVEVQETYTDSVNWGDLDTLGPLVTVTVRQTGRLLVTATTQMQWPAPTAAATVGVGGWATVDISGANTIAPATAANKLLPTFAVFAQVSAGTITHTCQVATTQQAVFDSLNPGETTLKMVYRNQVAGLNVDYGRRTLTVLTL